MANKTKNEKLLSYWNKQVNELVYRPNNSELHEGFKERHRLYSLLAMAITCYFWNGDKKGKEGTYPQNVPVNKQSSKYLKGDYYGHNILALAVDFDGRIIDFEMNHNSLYNSSAEHAEARLIKRIFSLSSINETWGLNLNLQSKTDYNTFEDVSVYTTLESCSQCSGVMALAQVKEIIYLQSDNGMFLIGNILRNLTEDTKLKAPNPIDGSEISFPYFEELNQSFELFCSNISNTNPFFIPDDSTQKPDISKSVTSFLCTQSAYNIFKKAELELSNFIDGKKNLEYPNFAPKKEIKNNAGFSEIKYAEFKNIQVIDEISNFLKYVKINGRRSTPHK